jgi:chromosome segregation ATPase
MTTAGVQGVDLPDTVAAIRAKRQELKGLSGSLDELHEWLHVQESDVRRLHEGIIDLIDQGATPEEVRAALAGVRAATDQFAAGQRQHDELRRRLAAVAADTSRLYRELVTGST